MTTPDTLLKCALELFAARGYDGVGVQEIVGAAGVTKPTLYHHFGSKEGMFVALLEQEGQPFLDLIETAAHYQHDLTGNLQKLTRLYLHVAEAQPDVYRLLASCALAPPASDAFRLATPYLHRQRGLLEALFEAASHDHGNMRGRARRYAASLLGVLDSAARLRLAGELNADDALIHDLVQQFSYGIYS